MTPYSENEFLSIQFNRTGEKSFMLKDTNHVPTVDVKAGMWYRKKCLPDGTMFQQLT
jgi:hypothetical protein